VRVRLRLPGTVWAGEACLVGTGHEVIVETVLPGEGKVKVTLHSVGR
jgi:hypothetical protein